MPLPVFQAAGRTCGLMRTGFPGYSWVGISQLTLANKMVFKAPPQNYGITIFRKEARNPSFSKHCEGLVMPTFKNNSIQQQEQRLSNFSLLSPLGGKERL